MRLPLSSSMKSVVMTAAQLAANAHIVDRQDDYVEIYANGKGRLLSKSEFVAAKDILDQYSIETLQTQGQSPPFSALQVLDMIDPLENLLHQRLENLNLRVVFIKGDTGGCAWWRCSEPSRLLNSKYPGLLYSEATNDISYESLLPFDVVVVQRALFGADTIPIMAIIKRLKSAGKRIVYENDDDLFSLMPDNQCYYAMTPDDKKAIEWITKESHAIFTTNAHLADRMGFAEKTFVLPNSLDLVRIVKPVRDAERDKHILVLWHGGDSHEVDINWMQKSLNNLIINRDRLQKETGKDIYFAFLGYFPKFLEPMMNVKYNVMIEPGNRDADLKKDVRELVIKGRNGLRYLKGVPPEQFHNYLAYLEPDICYCPLVDNEFVKSKSDIKVVESIVAGAGTVVANFGPYAMLPDNIVLKGKTPEQMGHAIQQLIVNPDKRRQLVIDGQEWVFKNRNLHDNVDLWYEALCKVVATPHDETVKVNES